MTVNFMYGGPMQIYNHNYFVKYVFLIFTIYLHYNIFFLKYIEESLLLDLNQK